MNKQNINSLAWSIDEMQSPCLDIAHLSKFHNNHH